MTESFNYSDVTIQQLITHRVGNKLKENSINLSQFRTEINTQETRDFLMQYFLAPFNPEAFFQFTHSVGLEHNDIYTITQRIFENSQNLVEDSHQIAKLLYDHSDHPKIKDGELNVVFFDNIVMDDEIVNGLGLFKSESNTPFLKMASGGESYQIDHEYGFELKGLDKGCLILNVDGADGYQCLVLDKTNKMIEAQYWMDDFLKMTPRSDNYHQTKDFLTLTKDFVSTELTVADGVQKTDKIDLLNRTMDYFKVNDKFDKEDFEKEVFQDQKVIDSFRAFDEEIRGEKESLESFDISNKAVKKQARVYKSVLKLDKNFHVYIHGDKSLIERGMEQDGRKFYKIYYEEEA